MATSIYGNYMIEEEFDPWLFLDPYSYPAAFKANKDRYFPEKGENVLLFFRYHSYITSVLLGERGFIKKPISSYF